MLLVTALLLKFASCLSFRDSAISFFLLLCISQPSPDVFFVKAYGQRNAYLQVSTILMEPYVTEKRDVVSDTDQEQLYEGYIVDLLDRLSTLLGLQYRLRVVGDGRFGYKQSDGHWNGMIGEVLRREVDMAAGPLYITHQRARVVDFTHAFLKDQATILMRRPPTGQSLPIQSAEELLDNAHLDYSTRQTGLIARAFRISNNTEHKQMWLTMKTKRPQSFTKTNEEGIMLVRNNLSQAFILPKTIGEYISSRKPCDLVTIDTFLTEEGFALAVPKGSPLLPQLNRALTIMEQIGFMKSLYEKWWIKQSQCNGAYSSKMYSLTSSGSTTGIYYPLSYIIMFLYIPAACLDHSPFCRNLD